MISDDTETINYEIFDNIGSLSHCDCTINLECNNGNIVYDNCDEFLNLIKNEFPDLSDFQHKIFMSKCVNNIVEFITDSSYKEIVLLFDESDPDPIIDENEYYEQYIDSENESENESYIFNIYDEQSLLSNNNQYQVSIKRDQNDIKLILGNFFKKKNVIKNHPNYSNDTTQCAICLDNTDDNDYVRILPKCKHFFHKKCVDKWFRDNDSCPTCRHNYFN